MRLFYNTDPAEPDLRRDIAASISPHPLPVLTLIPVPKPDPDGADLSLEGRAVISGLTRRHGDDHGFPQGIRRGKFAFTTAVRAQNATDLVAESTAVLQGLDTVLQGLGGKRPARPLCRGLRVPGSVHLR